MMCEETTLEFVLMLIGVWVCIGALFFTIFMIVDLIQIFRNETKRKNKARGKFK